MVLPRALPGLGLLLMAPGLLSRARLAWVIALLLAALSSALMLITVPRQPGAAADCAMLLLVLLSFARRFDRSSIAAGTLFTLLSVGSLLVYGTLGSLWFGAGYVPPITDLGTALYYAIETMSTVGYGDIVPVGAHARMFTVSLIVLGI
ncbi:MAG: potassium transporter TrkA, partial [Betaproteobacteria bacterium]|nr:potassium transporter TrkA [Betaproteobacteria bacterium]